MAMEYIDGELVFFEDEEIDLIDEEQDEDEE
jgi:hypothetical protein